MTTSRTQKMAMRLLEARSRNGYPIGLYLRWSARSHLIGIAYLAVALPLLAAIQWWGVFSLVAGMFLGMWLSNYGFLLASRRAWPFMSAVLDWDKVRAVAGDSERKLGAGKGMQSRASRR